MQMTKDINQTTYLLNLLDVNGYLFCKQKHQKCELTCCKFQINHAQGNHCLWMICFDHVCSVSLDSFD